MAKIDVARRAQIGQEKRARTRAQLVAAAHALYARRAIESVTVDDVVGEAGLAKGTFYVHFEDLDALTAAVADELIAMFDEVLQQQRRALSDPLARLVFGCSAFIEKAMRDPAWAAVVARMALSHASVGHITRVRLSEDLNAVLEEHGSDELSRALALEVVLGIMLQVLMACAERRLRPADRAGAITAILRAIGIGRPQIRAALARVEQIAQPAATADAPARPSRSGATRR